MQRNNVSTSRPTHLFIREGDGTGHAYEWYNHFLSSSPSFSSNVVAMSTSTLTGVCMTSNSFLESVHEDCDCPFLGDLIAGKKSNTILTLKVKKINRLAQKTNDVPCWIQHIIIPLGGYC